jgi:hypothetical protein
MFSCNPFDIVYLFTTVTIIFSQRHIRIKPELSTLMFPVHMHVAWFATVVGVEVETVGTDS